MTSYFRKIGTLRRMTAAALLGLCASAGSLAAQGTAVSQQTAAQSQPVALSLEDAVRMGESQSEAVVMARAGVQRSQGQLLQARSQFFPQIYGSAGYTRTLRSQFQALSDDDSGTEPAEPAPEPPCNDYLRDASASVSERLSGLEQASRCAAGINPIDAFRNLPFGQANQYQFGFSVTQNLFSGGRVAAQTSAASAGRRAAEIGLNAQRAQIVLDVTQAYYDAALADRLLAITEASYGQTENVVRQVQLARDVGNVSEFELLRAQVTRDNQRPLVIQRRGERDIAHFALKQLLNLPLEQPVILTTPIDGTAGLPPGIRLTGITVRDYNAADTAASSRATVREASEAVRAQESLLRVAQAERLPALSLTTQYGRVAYPASGLPSSGDYRTNWTVGVAAQLPLFTGGRIRGSAMVAQANLAESRARLQQVRELAALDSRVALNLLEQATAAFEASRGTAEQAARAYTIAEVRYREGISTQLELNDSRLLLEQATVNSALAARNLQVARVKLALLPHLPLQADGTGARGSGFQQDSQQRLTIPQSPQQSQPQTQQNPALANQQIPSGL